MNEYLPMETLEFCTSALAQCNIDLSSLQGSTTTVTGTRLHKEAYLRLRSIVWSHFASKTLPILQLCPSIRGGAQQAQTSHSRLGRLIHENYHATYDLRPTSEYSGVEEMIITDEDTGWVEIEEELPNS
jgi:hypothetical protein